MKNQYLAALKFMGSIIIIFAIAYAILGSLVLMGIMDRTLSGYESQEILLVILAYTVSLIVFIGGFACVKGNTGLAKIFGILFAIVGFVSLIYLQLVRNTFNIIDCLTMCSGISIFFISSKIDKSE